MILRKRLYERHSIFQGMYLAFKSSAIALVRSFLRHRQRRQASVMSGPRDEHSLRATPYLTLKDNGELRCTSCRLCESYCPTGCISIESEHAGTLEDEGPPDSFRIEILRCIYCGLCVEACPVDALRMSSERGRPGHAEQTWVLDEHVLAFRKSLGGGKGIASRVEDEDRSILRPL